MVLIRRGTGILQEKPKAFKHREVNTEYWKNKLRSYFVGSVINNGYTISFPSAESPFYASINKSSLRHAQFASQAFTKLLENNCQKTQTKTLLL